MALNAVAILNGVSQTIIVLLGIVYFFKFLIDFIRYKKKMTPLLALLVLSLGSMHLGGAVDFFMKLILNENLNYIVYGYLNYIHIPLGMTLAVYIVYKIFELKITWVYIGVSAALGIALLVAMIVRPDLMMEILPGQLIDINIEHVARVFITIYFILAAVILGPIFLKMSTILTENEEEMRKKYIFLGIGWSLWAGGEFLCSRNIFIAIIPNTIIFAALILISYGFAPSKSE